MGKLTIASDPRVMTGKPVVAGTRITVDLILDKMGSGGPIEAVLKAQPRLTREGCWLPSDSPLRRFELKSSTLSVQNPREPGPV